MSVELGQRDRRALELFELAMERELLGLMSDAVKYYREAFKINDHVDLVYRQQKVPKAIEQLTQEHGKNAGHRIDEAVLRKIDVDLLLLSYEHEEAQSPDPTNPDHYDENHMVVKLANLGMDKHEFVEERTPTSPLVHLPREVWSTILEILVLTDPELWFRFGVTCKKNAFLAFALLLIWAQMCHLVYPSQVYEENVGFLGDLPVPANPMDILPQYGHSWKQMLRDRPFIKFLGCYISVVNYYSEGGRQEFSSSWKNPVRTVTYYRYLRFYPDGTCVMALTALEPTDVVPQFLRKNKLRRILANPDSKEHINLAKEPHKIYHGHWAISTSGEVSVKVEDGPVVYCTFHYRFQIKNMASIRHAKLSWINYYAVYKEEEREGELVDFSLKNETAFKFLRVRSYSTDN